MCSTQKSKMFCEFKHIEKLFSGANNKGEAEPMDLHLEMWKDEVLSLWHVCLRLPPPAS